MSATLRAAMLALSLLLPMACAQTPSAPHSGAALAADPTDPWEATNRDIFAFNTAIDDCCLLPLAKGYRAALPAWVRERIRNVVSNAQEPRHGINAVLQGETLVAGETLMRFVINTTLGLGGMFDLAEIGGPPHQARDFGQTLFRWGVPDGPFVMAPILGPSNVRDFVGRFADGYMNPVSWLMPAWGNIARGTVEGLDLREQNIESLDALRAESLDFYARFRSVWQQRRSAQLGRTSEAPEGLDVLEDPGAPTPGPQSFRPGPGFGAGTRSAAPARTVAAAPSRQTKPQAAAPRRPRAGAARPGMAGVGPAGQAARRPAAGTAARPAAAVTPRAMRAGPARAGRPHAPVAAALRQAGPGPVRPAVAQKPASLALAASVTPAR